MKYTVAILMFAMGVFAIPQQASSITSAPATTSAPSYLTPQQSCAVACDAADVNCRAACFGNARPNASQAIETTECAAKCDQGSGSPEDTQKYSDCVQGCIAKLFPSSQTVTLANAAAGSSTNSAGATGSGATGSLRATNTASSTISSSGATGAANSNSAGFAGAGLAGLLAIFAF